MNGYFYRLEIHKSGMLWMTANDRWPWRRKARAVRQWRDTTAWRSRSLPRLAAAHVVCELLFADRRRRDPGNWAPTAKACVDGLVDAGVLPDDDGKHLLGPDMRLGPTVAKAYVGLALVIYPQAELFDA